VRDANPFEILGIPPNATYDATWDAYNELVRQCQASASTGATVAEQDERMSELNWAIDELEGHRDVWVQRSLRRTPEHEAPDYDMDRRPLPLLVNVFVVILAAGVGLILWSVLTSDDSSPAPPSSQQAASQLPPGPRNVPLQATMTASGVPAPAGPALAPIDVEQVKADIRRRNETPGSGPLQFVAPKLASLTGGSQPDVVIQWPSGGSCGNFGEVWGYNQGKVVNLSPRDDRNGNGFGCGGFETQDYLNMGREQLATVGRTYDPAQFSGGEYLGRTVWCWTGNEFITVVTYYETVDRKRLRTEQRNPQSRCK